MDKKKKKKKKKFDKTLADKMETNATKCLKEKMLKITITCKKSTTKSLKQKSFKKELFLHIYIKNTTHCLISNYKTTTTKNVDHLILYIFILPVKI